MPFFLSCDDTIWRLNEFIESLKLTDQLVLTDIYAASEKPAEGVDIKELFEPLKKELGDRVIYLKKDKILAHLSDSVQQGDLVLFLGAGDIYHCSDELVDILSKRRVMV